MLNFLAVSENLLQTNGNSGVQHFETKKNDGKICETNQCNVSYNKIDDFVMDENGEEQSNPSKSSSESQAAAIAKLNVTDDDNIANDSHPPALVAHSDSPAPRSNNNCPGSSNMNNITTINDVPSIPTTVPLCNGHATQFSASTNAESSALRGDQGQPVGGCSKDFVEAPMSVCCMSNAVSGAGESLVHDIELCDIGTSSLVNSISLKSFDADLEDMQTEASSDKSKSFI